VQRFEIRQLHPNAVCFAQHVCLPEYLKNVSPSPIMPHISTLTLLQQLESGELTSRAITEQCLARIAALNGDLNAFLYVDSAGALARADEIDLRRRRGERVGRLAGLPVGVKDNFCVRGMPATAGSRMLEGFVPPYSAHVVERIESEDGVILGKLNLDEFAMGSSSETGYFGAVRNPWNLRLTAGGSSGGSAAAVAAGLVFGHWWFDPAAGCILWCDGFEANIRSGIALRIDCIRQFAGSGRTARCGCRGLQFVAGVYCRA
jgi:hypothetical protein